MIRIQIVGNNTHNKIDFIHQIASLISRQHNIGVVIENTTYSKYYGIQGDDYIEFENLTFAKEFRAIEDSKDIYITDFEMAQADVALIIAEGNLLSMEFLKSQLPTLNASRVVLVFIDMLDSVFDRQYWTDYYLNPLLKGKNVSVACIDFDERDQISWLKQLLGSSLTTMCLSKHRQKALLDVYYKLLGEKFLDSRKKLIPKEWRWRMC